MVKQFLVINKAIVIAILNGNIPFLAVQGVQSNSNMSRSISVKWCQNPLHWHSIS